METLVPIILGAIITLLTQFSKRSGLSNRLVLAIFVIIVAAAYTSYQFFADEVIKAQVAAFSAQTFGSAVFFYEYFVRIIESKSKSVSEVNKLS